MLQKPGSSVQVPQKQSCQMIAVAAVVVAAAVRGLIEQSCRRSADSVVVPELERKPQTAVVVAVVVVALVPVRSYQTIDCLMGLQM